MIPETLVEQLKQLNRAQKLRVLHMLSEELGEQDWVYRAYTPDGDADAARVLQELAQESEHTEQPTPN